jgi:hypothetical protein
MRRPCGRHDVEWTRAVEEQLMRCGSYAVSQVLVGLHRVGIVGLHQACEKVAAAGLGGRAEVVNFLLDELATDNFIPEGQEEAYRTALWREFLRFLGEDFSEFFSEIEVTVRGEPGEDRDRLADLCASVLADFELRPVLEFTGAEEEGPNPQLVIGDTMVARGLPSRRSLKATVRQRLSDW